MFDHVTIEVASRTLSERFDRIVLSTLGVETTSTGADFVGWDDFSLAQADAGHPVTRRLHVGFVAPTRAHVDAFWRAGTEAGFPDDGAPGPRPEYRSDYYGAFHRAACGRRHRLTDPDGNSAEAVHHDALRNGGRVDHLWIRVADVAAAKRFYAMIAPHAGLRLAGDRPEIAHFTSASGSFSLVAGTPTEHVHPGYHAAFLLDPDGNTVEVVNHNRG